MTGDKGYLYCNFTFFISLLLSFSPFLLKAQSDSLQIFSNLKKLSLEELMNIEVVTASGSEQKLSEAPSTMQVVTAQQIQERGYEQLEDVLRDIAGVDLIHLYGRAPSFITFRGMYGDENRRMLVMIDGVVENSLMGGIEMAGPAYSLHNAERIEIIWGPGSALYGANAFSAVINIITKKGGDINPTGTKAALHYQKGYGTYNTSIENIMLGAKKSYVELMLSGSLYNTDGPCFTNRHPTYSNSYVNNAWSLNGNISYAIKKVKATLGARAFQTPHGMGTFFAAPTQITGNPSPGNLNTGSSGILQDDFNGEKSSLVETYARTAFLQSEYTLNPKLNFFIKGQYRETGRSDKSYYYSHLPGTNFLRRSIFAYYANRIGIEASSNYIIAENHQLTAGVQFSQDNLERGFRGVIRDIQFDTIENILVTNLNAVFKTREYTIQNNSGAYLQYVWNTTLLNKTNFTLGGRYDNNNVYGSTINPRVGVICQPYDKFSFKILYGSAFRAPTNFELSAVGTRIANPGLEPEKIRTYEVNFIYTPLKILLVQANLFQNTLHDIIIQDVSVDGGKTQNQNIGSASVKGIETKVDIVPSKLFSAFLNFTYQDGRQNDSTMESPIPNIARVKGNIGFSIRIAELFSVNIIENWVGDRSVPATNPLGKVNGYFVTNLVLMTNKLFDDRVSASLSIRNLLNQTYYDPGIRTADGNFYGTVHEQPGINGLLKVAVSLY